MAGERGILQCQDGRLITKTLLVDTREDVSNMYTAGLLRRQDADRLGEALPHLQW